MKRVAAMHVLDGQRENTGPRPRALLLTVLLSVVAAGCGQSDPLSGAKLYPVKGTVVLSDGKPLTSGRIFFVATTSTITSVADIASDGAFTFKGAAGDGLPEGPYKIRIEAGSSGNGVKGATGKLNPTAPFAMKYLDEDSSELTATVGPEESKNKFEIKLETHDRAAQLKGGASDRNDRQ
jgi:hypothetical protein